MDHDDVLEEIELAAVEPGGLARLMAGDTPVAAAVVGHLAGCERCAEELRRMSRAAPLLRDVVRTTPPADLRDRTLAYVREYGRPRGDEAGIGAAHAAAATSGVVIVGSAGFIAGRAEVDRYGNAVNALEAVNEATLDISADPESRRVVLAST